MDRKACRQTGAEEGKKERLSYNKGQKKRKKRCVCVGGGGGGGGRVGGGGKTKMDDIEEIKL